MFSFFKENSTLKSSILLYLLLLTLLYFYKPNIFTEHNTAKTIWLIIIISIIAYMVTKKCL